MPLSRCCRCRWSEPGRTTARRSAQEGRSRPRRRSAEWETAGPTGGLTYSEPNQTYALAGGGADVWGNADQFHYAFKTLTGDGTMVARVISRPNASRLRSSNRPPNPGIAASGSHTSATIGNLKFSRMTPTTSDGTSLTISVRPTIDGSPPYRLRQTLSATAMIRRPKAFGLVSLSATAS